MDSDSKQPESAVKMLYAISTVTGAVPYVIDYASTVFKRPKVIFLDDFLYKNSIYDKNQKIDVATLIGANTGIAVAFRNPTACKKGIRIITSKAGNYKLTSDMYKNIINLMNVKTCADFNTGVLVIDEKEFVEPVDLNGYAKCQNVIFGTQIINKLTSDGMMLYVDDATLKCKHLNDTDNEYEKYMLSINEMNAFTFISEHNYRILYEFSGL